MAYVKYIMVRSGEYTYRDLYQKKITIYLVYNSVLILKAFSTYMLRHLISLTLVLDIYSLSFNIVWASPIVSSVQIFNS